MAKRILVVDDERHIVRLVQVNLERAWLRGGDRLRWKEAVGKVKEVNPDLIVCDVMMPYMDGFEVLRTIRADPETRISPSSC